MDTALACKRARLAKFGKTGQGDKPVCLYISLA